MEPDYLFADALLAALLACARWPSDERSKNVPPPRPRRHIPRQPSDYQPTLVGVTIERERHRLRARYCQKLLGEGEPTWEEECRLHELYLAAKDAAMDAALRTSTPCRCCGRPIQQPATGRRRVFCSAACHARGAKQ